jgi:hypothetical protein
MIRHPKRKTHPFMWLVWRWLARALGVIGVVLAWPGCALLDLSDYCRDKAWEARSRHDAKYPNKPDPNFVRARVLE